MFARIGESRLPVHDVAFVGDVLHVEREFVRAPDVGEKAVHGGVAGKRERPHHVVPLARAIANIVDAQAEAQSFRGPLRNMYLVHSDAI